LSKGTAYITAEVQDKEGGRFKRIGYWKIPPY
jgi:hypothetical protein